MDIVKKGSPTPKHLELNQPPQATIFRHATVTLVARLTGRSRSDMHDSLDMAYV